MFSLHWHGMPLTPARVVQALQRRVRDRLQPINEVRGVYPTFAAAVAAAPRIKPLGYDSAAAGDWYADKQTGVQLEDYPVLYWLRHAFADSTSVLEIGGHVGVAYYGFSKVLDYPPGLVWTILDVPTVMAAGETIARQRGAAGLRFAHEGLTAEHGADIVLAAGALQYLETDIAAILTGFVHRPRHVLINVTPIYDGPAFATVQNVSTVYCAYRVFNRQELVGSLESVGYQLVDSWAKPRRFRVPGHPDRSFDHYSGLYFRAR